MSRPKRVKTKIDRRSYATAAEQIRPSLELIEAYGAGRTSDVSELSIAIRVVSTEAQRLEQQHLRATQWPDVEFSLDGPTVELPDVEFSLDGPDSMERTDDEE